MAVDELDSVDYYPPPGAVPAMPASPPVPARAPTQALAEPSATEMMPVDYDTLGEDAPPPATGAASAGGAAGKTVAVVALAATAGWFLGRTKGAAAGLLIAGSAFNLYRASRWWSSSVESEREEAGRSVTLGIAALGIGGWLVYLASQDKARAAA